MRLISFRLNNYRQIVFFHSSTKQKPPAYIIFYYSLVSFLCGRVCARMFASVADEMREGGSGFFLCDKSRWSTTYIIWWSALAYLIHPIEAYEPHIAPPILALSLLVVCFFLLRLPLVLVRRFADVWVGAEAGKEARASRSGTRWRLHFMVAFLFALLLLDYRAVRLFA